jgi:hypothetical protein
MKFVLPAALALGVMIASPASAAPFETLGGPVGGGSNVASSLGLTLSAFEGVVNIVIPAINIKGTADAIVDLDLLGNGSVQILSSNFTLADTTGSVSSPFGKVDYTFTGVGFSIVFGPSAATGGAFTIADTTPGSLQLNQGTVKLKVGVLVNETLDLAADPIGLNFDELGAQTLLGTTDNTLAGNDTTDPGDEINIAWNGVGTDVDLDGTALTVTLTGAGISIGAVVPEPTSGLFLASLVTGTGAVVRRRRK